MPAAYLNQTINLLVGILMVPTLLKYLNLSEYILWVIFTTIGGVTLQIESSIQFVSAREIAREYHAGRSRGLARAVRRARKVYAALALGVLLLVLGVGFLYLASVAKQAVGTGWGAEWCVFTAAYALNYYFGANNSILLALEKVEMYNYVNSLTRALNYLGTLSMLAAGFSVMGVCISFAFSVVVGCSVIALVARRALLENVPAPDALTSAGNASERASVIDMVRYTLYMVAAFALYKGSLLVAASLFPKTVVGSYGLTLQAFTMLSAFALVPIQICLARLVKAILNDDHAAVVAELQHTFVFANLLFLAGTTLLALFGNTLLRSLGIDVGFPPTPELLSVALAFLIELNLFVLVNVLVTKQRYDFVRVYVASAATGLALALSGVWLTRELFLSLVVLPAAVQALVCVPLVLGRVCTELNTSPAQLIRSLCHIGGIRG